MNKKSEFIKNTFILGFGIILARMMSFILLPLFTIYLTPSEFGIYDLIVSYAMYLAPLMTIQLEWSAFRFLIDARSDEEEKRRIISNVSLMVTGVSFTYAVLFYIVNIFVQIPYFELVLLLIMSVIFSSVTLQFARGLGDNKKFAIASVFTGTIALLSVLALVIFAGWGIEGALLSMALANIVAGAYLVLSLGLHRYISLSYANISLQKKLVKYSFPLVPEGVSFWVLNASDRIIISLVISTAANGIYAVANRYAMMFGAIFSIFNMSWNESASMHINDKDRDRFFSETSNAMVKFFGSLGLVMIAFLPLVFDILIGQRFAEAYVYVPILVLGAYFHAIAGLYSSIYVAKKNTKQIAKTIIVAAVINLIINLALISYIGIYAAAISTAVAYFFLAVYRHYDVKKYVTITYDARIFASLIALFGVVISLYYLNNMLTNVANAAVAIAFALLLNRSIVATIKDKLLARRRVLTPDQQVAEEIRERVI